MLGRLLGAVALLVVAAAAALGFLYWKEAQGLDPAELEARYMTPADRMVLIDGARVRVREEGPAEAPSVLLVHGFTFSLESFDAWAADLARDHRVVRFDLLGHGLTGPDPQRRYSPEARAAFLGAVMDAAGLERATVVGNSLGGLAAWRFAAAHPDRVDRLILIAPGAYPVNGVTDAPASAPAAVEAFLRTAPEAAVRASVEMLYADDARITPERLAVIRDMMRRRGNGAAFVESLEQFTLPDPEPALRTVGAPTLILWGAGDVLLPVAQGSAMAAAIPDARLIVYDDLGHVLHEEAPARTLDDARRFLAEAPAPPEPAQ